MNDENNLTYWKDDSSDSKPYFMDLSEVWDGVIDDLNRGNNKGISHVKY